FLVFSCAGCRETFSRFPGLEPLLRVDAAEERDEERDEAGPSGLVARAKARAVVPVEVLVEQHVIPPVRVFLEFRRAAVHGPAAMLVPLEDTCQAVGNVVCDLEQIHTTARAGRTLDRKRIAVIQMELQQRANQEHVPGHPDRTAPVRVASEHAAVGFGRQIVDAILGAARTEDIRMLFVVARKRAYAVWAEELLLVEHLLQNPSQPLLVDDGHDATARMA